MKHRQGWLEVLVDGKVQRTWPLTDASTRIGRAPDNDLVFPATTVSGSHALIELSPTVRVVDLDSRNGTTVNGVRIDGAVELKDGDMLTLGSDVELRVRVGSDESEAPVAWLWDRQTGRCFGIPDGGGEVGTILGRACVADEGPFMLTLTEQGGQIEGPDGETPLRFGEPFQVAGCHLELLHRERALASTVAGDEKDRWVLRVDLNGPTGAQAEVLAPGGRLRGTIRAGNRVALLHLLADKALKDDVEGDEAGWVEDTDIMQGVWGRRWTEKAPSSLQVLVHRVRRDLAGLGLAGGVIQKRSGWTRLRPAVLEIAPPPER